MPFGFTEHSYHLFLFYSTAYACKQQTLTTTLQKKKLITITVCLSFLSNKHKENKDQLRKVQYESNLCLMLNYILIAISILQYMHAKHLTVTLTTTQPKGKE
jgi:hypothetical protein